MCFLVREPTRNLAGVRALQFRIKSYNLKLCADFAAFVDVDDVEEGLDFIPVGDAVFLFTFSEARAGIVAPTALPKIAVKDFDFFFGRFAAVGKTPFENVLILAASFTRATTSSYFTPSKLQQRPSKPRPRFL